MLQITKQVDYGIQLLLAVNPCKHSDPISLRKFAFERNISFLFLQKIAGKLKKAGIIGAVKGSKGGYFLAKDESLITIKSVIEALEGKKEITECIDKQYIPCPLIEHCKSKKPLAKLQDEIAEVLSRYTLASMKV